MAAHDHIVATAKSKVACHLDEHAYRLINYYEKRRKEKFADDKRRPDEPHSLANTMSPVALHDWRLVMRAHERRRDRAR